MPVGGRAGAIIGSITGTRVGAAARDLAAFVRPGAGFAGSDTGSGGTVTGFVCPDFNGGSQAGHKNPNAQQICGGDYSVIGPNVSVAKTATNDNGAGSPRG